MVCIAKVESAENIESFQPTKDAMSVPYVDHVIGRCSNAILTFDLFEGFPRFAGTFRCCRCTNVTHGGVAWCAAVVIARVPVATQRQGHRIRKMLAFRPWFAFHVCQLRSSARDSSNLIPFGLARPHWLYHHPPVSFSAQFVGYLMMKKSNRGLNAFRNSTFSSWSDFANAHKYKVVICCCAAIDEYAPVRRKKKASKER